MGCAQTAVVSGIEVPSSINDHTVPKVVSQFSRTTAHVPDHEWSKFGNPQSAAEIEARGASARRCRWWR
jgi:hypothetical protein